MVKVLYLKFRHMTARVDIDADAKELADVLKKLFVISKVKGDEPSTYLSIVKAEGYSLLIEGHLVMKDVDLARVLYGINNHLRNAILKMPDFQEVLIHGAIATYSQRSVLFIGQSGCGKTSLSLLIGKGERWPGDEYVWISPESGLAIEEPLPVQVKPIGLDVVPKSKRTRAVRISDERDMPHFLFPAVPGFETANDLVVFLEYESEAETRLWCPPVADLPALVMPSVLIKGKRHCAYLFFLKFLDIAKPQLLCMRYSDLNNAAKMIEERLSE